MPGWLVYGVLTAIIWGASAVVTKVAVSKKYFGLPATHATFFMLIGIGIVFLSYFFLTTRLDLSNKQGAAAAAASGVLWAVGSILTIRALGEGADISRLTPIYNTNTLIAVILGIILLHELPKAGEAFKVILGAVLIVLGSILVSI